MIENNLHQIWVGNTRIPSHIKENMDKVREHHKDFNYYFWNDDNLPELPDHLKKMYDAYQHPAIKADLLRMYVIYKFGGTYLDADIVPINGLYSEFILHQQYDGFIIYNESYQLSALANTIFGFKKKNPLLKYMIDNVTHENQWIGPNWWIQIVCKYLNVDINQLTVEQFREKLSTLNLQLVRWKDVEDNCFTHEALASWIDGSTWNKKLKNGDYD